MQCKKLNLLGLGSNKVRMRFSAIPAVSHFSFCFEPCSLFFTQLTGEMPDLIGDLKELRSVSLSGNQLEDLPPGDIDDAENVHRWYAAILAEKRYKKANLLMCTVS